MPGNLVRAGSIATRSHFGRKFWATLLKSSEKAGGSDKISVAGWEKLLEIAREEGLVARVCDEDGNPTNAVSSVWTYALVVQYRRVMQAKAEGLTAEEFADSVEADVIASQLGVKDARDDYNRHHANVQREQQDQRDRFSRSSQRTFRSLDNEEEIA